MYRLLTLSLLLYGVASAVPVTVKVEDSSGAPLKNELVIIQDLNSREHEVLRALTDDAGALRSFELNPGLYRVIATAPYGPWQTEVREFLVMQEPVKITLQVQPVPTHGSGDVVVTGTQLTEVQVVNSDGQAVMGAKVLSRDSSASSRSERWYTTDEKGTARVELVDDPTVLVICYGDALVSREVRAKDSKVVVRLTQQMKGLRNP